MEFLELPTVFSVFNVLRRGSFWWKEFSKHDETDGRYGSSPFSLSREARLLLISCTGLPLKDVLFIETEKLLGMKADRAALGRLKNWLITLDGLLISILLGSQGHPELCNWIFFDKIMQTYLKTAVSDLFNMGTKVETYYERLKKARNLLKDKVLKERTLLPRRKDGNVFDGNFWYLDRIISVLGLDVEILTPKKLLTISYLTQNRSAGLPPKPIELKAVEKWKATVGSVPRPLSPLQKYDVSRGVDLLCSEIRSNGNFEGLLNTACSQSKISI